MPKKTIVYIDGYNLYYSRLKNTPYKWLDIVTLFRDQILKPQDPSAEVISKSGEQTRRLGFMKGMMKVPDDFDRMGDDDIGSLFAGSIVKFILGTHRPV